MFLYFQEIDLIPRVGLLRLPTQTNDDNIVFKTSTLKFILLLYVVLRYEHLPRFLISLTFTFICVLFGTNLGTVSSFFNV